MVDLYYPGLGVGSPSTGHYRGGRAPRTKRLREGDGEAVLDRVGVGVLQFEGLAYTFHLGTAGFELAVELRTLGVQGFVHVKIDILDVGVLLPGVRGRTAHDDPDAVVLNSAGKVFRQSALTDKLAHSFLYFRTQGVNGSFTLVLA